MEYKDKILKIVTSSEVIKIFNNTKKSFEFLKFYNFLENFLKKDIPYGELRDKFILCIAIDLESKDLGRWNLFEEGILTSKIKEGLLAKNNVILSNLKGDVIDIKNQFIYDYINAQKLSKDQSCPVFFIDYMTVHLCINGESQVYIPNIVDSTRKGVGTKKSFLPVREYRKLIEDQYQSMVYKQKCFTYWKCQKDRILMGNAEVLFNKNLWWYLDQYILEGLVERGSTISGIEDRTDIKISTFDGEIYIIEIKCLGKSESSSSERSDDWANIGLIQLNIYLNDEKYAKEGILVLYDGRINNQEIKLYRDPSIDWHPGLDRRTMRFFLKSEPASIEAIKKHRKLKKKR